MRRLLNGEVSVGHPINLRSRGRRCNSRCRDRHVPAGLGGCGRLALLEDHVPIGGEQQINARVQFLHFARALPADELGKGPDALVVRTRRGQRRNRPPAADDRDHQRILAVSQFRLGDAQHLHQRRLARISARQTQDRELQLQRQGRMKLRPVGCNLRKFDRLCNAHQRLVKLRGQSIVLGPIAALQQHPHARLPRQQPPRKLPPRRRIELPREHYLIELSSPDQRRIFTAFWKAHDDPRQFTRALALPDGCILRSHVRRHVHHADLDVHWPLRHFFKNRAIRIAQFAFGENHHLVRRRRPALQRCTPTLGAQQRPTSSPPRACRSAISL